MLEKIIGNYLGTFGFSVGLLIYYWWHDKPPDFLQRAFAAISIWALLDTLKLFTAYRQDKNKKGGTDASSE
jgi:uncharacterized membrane protein YedE/YeeE